MKLSAFAVLTALSAGLLATPAFAQEAASPETSTTANTPEAPAQTAEEATEEAPAEADVAPATAVAAGTETAPATEDVAPAGVTEAVYTAACEAGFSLAEGNSSNRVLAAGCNASRQGEKWLVGFSGKTRFGQTRFGGPKYPGGPKHPRGDFQLTENNWEAALREERSLTESKSQYIFLIEGVASDQFKGFWTRYDFQAGYGYAFLNEPDTQLKLEIGGQFNRDYLVVVNADGDKQENRLGGVLTLIGEKKLNDAVLLAGRISYMPNLEEPDTDYRIQGESSLTARLAEKISFKTVAQVAYDNEPPLVAPVDKAGQGIAAAPSVPARRTDVTWNNLVVVTIF